MKTSLCWIRRDVRLSDNSALALATEQSDQVYLCFVFDSNILSKLEDRDDRRMTFIHQSVEEMRRRLTEYGATLLTAFGNPVELIPTLAETVRAEVVFASHDDDPYAVSRDQCVKARLEVTGRTMVTCKDHVVFERREVLNQSGEPFKVFTPYSKAWKQSLVPANIEARQVEYNRVASISQDGDYSPFELQLPELVSLGFEKTPLWVEPGEGAAMKQLDNFLESRIGAYAESRDTPSLNGTSGLSVHLRFGTVSIRECVRRVVDRAERSSAKWLDELIWREFYHMILANFPLCTEHPFKPEFEGVAWPGDLAQFEAWCQGVTGYPLVDAAMRCLRATGWMHNRLRMVAAMFLTKDLLLDYRLGEQWFARYLLDYELASNNGGWQWSASTGVDAQPWFRIFNPLTQSRKFDPEGKFIRTWCPELTGFDNEQIHNPSEVSQLEQLAAGCVVGVNYPAPIVDHSTQRQVALSFLESVSKSGRDKV